MLDCGNFLIRPLKAQDRESLAKYANNYQIARNLRDRFPHPYTVVDAEWFIDFCQQPPAPPSYGIIKAGECIGVIGFIPQEDVYRKNAEFGYWVGEPFWGQGIATLAAQKMTRFIFDNFEITRLFAGVFEYNPASRKVLEKAGFTLDCIFQKSIFKENQYWNEYRYSLLK